MTTEDKKFKDKIYEAVDSHYPLMITKQENNKLDELIERGYINPFFLIMSRRFKIVVKQ
jgi:hypothetical protein